MRKLDRYGSPRHRLQDKRLAAKRKGHPVSTYLVDIGLGPRKLKLYRRISGEWRTKAPASLKLRSKLERRRFRNARFDGSRVPAFVRLKRRRLRMHRVHQVLRLASS